MIAVRVVSVAGEVVAAGVRVVTVAVFESRSSICEQVHISRHAVGAVAVAAETSMAVGG